MSGISVNTDLLRRWLAEKMQPDAVKAELIARGLDQEAVNAHLLVFNKLRNERKQFAGFICCGLGAVMGFVSCVISIFNPIPELYGVFLYGLTSVAILVIFAGLYLLFE
jgi:hypothetical protein